LLLLGAGVLVEYASSINFSWRPTWHTPSTEIATADDDVAEESEAVTLQRKWQQAFSSASRAPPKAPSLLSAAVSAILLVLGLLLTAAGVLQGGESHLVVPLIIDTDMSFDVDDVGAICIAHALMDRGEADLLAVVHSSGYPEGIGAASALNEWYGHHSVKLGAYKGCVYRRALALAPDSSVAIAVIGFATNIAPLLRSSPDEISTLSGRDLVARKVKLIVWQESCLSRHALLRRPLERLHLSQGGWYEPLHANGKPTFNWDCGGCCGYTSVGCLGARATAALALDV
ncbi:MAG: hypothetical protein SGPRY_002090, partial [Prymnesium sp.]